MSAAIARALGAEGMVSQTCRNGREGEDEAASGEFDVIVLDVMLPDQDGLVVCRNLRRRNVATPVLMLTALSETTDKVAGLEAGADDYLAKPFDIDELVARLRALSRRVRTFDESLLRYEDIEAHLPRRTVTRSGKSISLTSKQFDLLTYLLRHPEEVLSRSKIGQHVWDMNFDPESNVIDVFIGQLRRKVDRPFESPRIHTVIGVGYMLSKAGPGELVDS